MLRRWPKIRTTSGQGLVLAVSPDPAVIKSGEQNKTPRARSPPNAVNRFSQVVRSYKLTPKSGPTLIKRWANASDPGPICEAAF